MSLETWKEEFYPIEADKSVGSQLEAVEHSLRKWRGLDADTLKRHGLRQAYNGLKEDGEPHFFIDYTSCALCLLVNAVNDGCDKCPLFKARGGFPCDELMMDEDENLLEDSSPYVTWTRFNDPAHMLEWLEKTREFVLLEKEKLENGHDHDI